MNETETVDNWFSRAKAEADKGIPPNERVVGIAIVVVSILMMLYCVAHQMWSTGFFTAAFGTLCFMGILLLGLLQVPWKGCLVKDSFLASLMFSVELFSSLLVSLGS